MTSKMSLRHPPSAAPVGNPRSRSWVSWRRHVNKRPVLIVPFCNPLRHGARCKRPLHNPKLVAGVHRRRRSRRTRTSTCSGRSPSRGRLPASCDASPIATAVHPNNGTNHRGHARISGRCCSTHAYSSPTAPACGLAGCGGRMSVIGPLWRPAHSFPTRNEVN